MGLTCGAVQVMVSSDTFLIALLFGAGIVITSVVYIYWLTACAILALVALHLVGAPPTAIIRCATPVAARGRGRFVV
jgi:hypothetical protein